MEKQETRTKKSIKNSIISSLSYIITFVLGFISRTIFIKYLSVEYLGISGLFTNVLTVLSFTELGIGEALIYAMYKPAKERNLKKMKKLLDFYKISYRWISVVILAIGFILSFFINVLVAEKPNISENFQIIFWLFLINNVCSYMLVYKQSLLLVDQNKYIVSIIQTATNFIRTMLQLFVLILTKNYYLYLIVNLVCTILNNFILSVYVDKKYLWIKETREENEKLLDIEKNKIFKDIKALSISKIAGVVSNGTDNIIISKIIGLTSVGIISNYTLLINSVNSFLWTSLTSVSGSFGNFNVDASIEKKRQVYEELYLFTSWLYIFICVCLLVLLNPFIEVWLGKEYITDFRTKFALVLIVFINGINFPTYTFRTTCGFFDEVKIAYILSGIFNIIFSIFFGIKWGLFGIFIATSISRLFTSELKEGIIVYKSILKLPISKYFLKYFFNISTLVVIYLITQYIINLIKMDGFFAFIYKGIVCIIVCNIFLLIRYWHTDVFKSFLIRIKTLLV